MYTGSGSVTSGDYKQDLYCYSRLYLLSVVYHPTGCLLWLSWGAWCHGLFRRLIYVAVLCSYIGMLQWYCFVFVLHCFSLYQKSFFGVFGGFFPWMYWPCTLNERDYACSLLLWPIPIVWLLYVVLYVVLYDHHRAVPHSLITVAWLPHGESSIVLCMKGLNRRRLNLTLTHQ